VTLDLDLVEVLLHGVRLLNHCLKPS
jgi:hypothetical protein